VATFELAQLEIDRVARLAAISARHADNHPSELEEALAGAGEGSDGSS
jgi:hypothetical protein